MRSLVTMLSEKRPVFSSGAQVPPNPSLKAPTRYGSHRLAASGLCEYHPCAASRRLPPRSA